MHFDKYQSEEAAKNIAKFETKIGFEFGVGVAFDLLLGNKKLLPKQSLKKKMSKIV